MKGRKNGGAAWIPRRLLSSRSPDVGILASSSLPASDTHAQSAAHAGDLLRPISLLINVIDAARGGLPPPPRQVHYNAFVPPMWRKGGWGGSGGLVQNGVFVRATSLEKSNLIRVFSLLCCEMKFHCANPSPTTHRLSIHSLTLSLEACTFLFFCKVEILIPS